MIVGQVERKDFGRLALQEQNYSRLLSDLTKLVIEVNEPEQASEAIARAFHVAESGTPGPVAVVVPEDVFDGETDAAVDPARPRVVAGPRSEDPDRPARMLAGGARPPGPVGAAFGADAGAPADAKKRRDWVDGLNAIHRKLLGKEWEPTDDGVNFAAIVCEVDKHLAPDATVTTDAGNFASFVHRYIGFRQSQVMLASVVGAMGSGMPMAVAAALRRPGTQVVAFLGDGGALMTGNEIATARQYGANPIMIISDNGMYGTIGMHSYVRYPERALMAGTRLTNPDFAQWGRSFGAEGITITSESEVADGIARAFAVKTRPVVVHCLTSAIQMSAWRRYTRSATLP